MITSLALVAIGFGITVIAANLRSRQLIKRHQMFGLFALADAVQAVGLALGSSWAVSPIVRGFYSTSAALLAVGAAWFAYQWWHGGGGDDTKRRLRRWARKFSPVRRTAPAGAS